jgi:hypothetical protein
VFFLRRGETQNSRGKMAVAMACVSRLHGDAGPSADSSFGGVDARPVASQETDVQTDKELQDHLPYGLMEVFLETSRGYTSEGPLLRYKPTDRLNQLNRNYHVARI